MTDEVKRKGRGPDKAPRKSRATIEGLVHINMRLPKDVIDFYKRDGAGHTKLMRSVLTEYADTNK